MIAKEVKWLAMRQGIRIHQYLRQLVGQSYVPLGLSSTDTNPSNPLSRIGLASERGKIRTGTQASFQFRRLPVQLERGQGQTHHRMLGDPTVEDTRDFSQPSVSGPEIHAPDRTTACYRKAGTFGQVAYETHTVAPQEQLEIAGNAGEDHSHSKVTPPQAWGQVHGAKYKYNYFAKLQVQVLISRVKYKYFEKLQVQVLL